jgi:hypothetical protein
MAAEHADPVGHLRGAENAVAAGLVRIAGCRIIVPTDDAVGVVGGRGADHAVAVGAGIRKCGHDTLPRTMARALIGLRRVCGGDGMHLLLYVVD